VSKLQRVNEWQNQYHIEYFSQQSEIIEDACAQSKAGVTIESWESWGQTLLLA
jgi:hypothetical protein